MITPKFMEGLKSSMMTARNYTYSVEDAVNRGSLDEVSKEIASLVGHVLHCQAIFVAKVTYEASIEEQKESSAKTE